MHTTFFTALITWDNHDGMCLWQLDPVSWGWVEHSSNSTLKHTDECKAKLSQLQWTLFSKEVPAIWLQLSDEQMKHYKMQKATKKRGTLATKNCKAWKFPFVYLIPSNILYYAIPVVQQAYTPGNTHWPQFLDAATLQVCRRKREREKNERGGNKYYNHTDKTCDYPRKASHRYI